MKPGTKPKPTVFKIREGVRKARINFAEPVAPESLAEPPDWLSESARAHWDRLAEQLDLMHVGPFSCDRDAFTALVIQADTVDRLAQICTEAPVLIRNTHGEPVPNPVFVRHERASAALVKLSLAVSPRSTRCGKRRPLGSGLIGGGLVVWGDGSGGAVDGDELSRVEALGGVTGGDDGGDGVFAGDEGGVSGEGAAVGDDRGC